MEGESELLAKVRTLGLEAPLVAKKAINEVSEQYASELKSNTPKDNEVGQHLADSVTITGFKGSLTGEFSKSIGFDKGVGWRAHFPNSGTIHQPAQHFIEKTTNAMTPKAQAIYLASLKELI